MDTIYLIVLDGIGDRPIEKFGRKTPLEAAHTPILDKLVQMGINGAMNTIDIGVKPGSDTAHLALFGYDPRVHYSGRGPYEVAGIGMETVPGDICFRVNMGTVDEKMVVVDRRAGRVEDTSEYAKLLDGTEIDGVRFILKPGTAYRLGMIMRGKNLSSEITDVDPKEAGLTIKQAKARDGSKQAEFTAKVLNKFVELSHKKLNKLPSNQERVKKGELSANCLLVRGAGKYPDMEPFEEKYRLRACCIAGAGLYKGIARVLGMDVLEVAGATGKPDTNVRAKIEKAIAVKKDYDFVFVHIKAADSFGEDGDSDGKLKFIEKIDEAMVPLVGLPGAVVAVTADHSTPCELKGHSADDVPIVIVSPRVRDDDVEHFSERECAKGRLGHIKGEHVMPILLDIVGIAEKFGA